MAYYKYQRQAKASAGIKDNTNNTQITKLKREINQLKLKQDGWANLLTNLGTKQDPRSGNFFKSTNNIRSLRELEELYSYDSLARRVIDIIPQDMLSKGFSISGDTDDEIIKYLNKLHTNQKLVELLSWARLYGGAIMIIGVNDGRALDKPVNENAIKSIEWLHVFDRQYITINDFNRYKDPNNIKFGEVEYYEVTPIYGGVPFLVHETRVIRADGLKLPPQMQRDNDGWSASVLENAWDEFSNIGATYNYVANIVKEFVQPILKMTELANLLAQGKESLVQKRIDIIALSKSIINMVLIDEKEDYQKLSSNVTGLDKILDAFDRKLSAATGIPLTRLMGISPGGLDSTGESDLANYYDMISGLQMNQLTPMIKKLLDYLLLAADRPISLSEYTIEYNPLVVLDDKQLAQLRNLQAQTDQIYIQNKAIHPFEIRNSRFGGEVYSTETILQSELENDLQEMIDNNEKPEIDDKSNLPGEADNSQSTIGNLARNE